MGNRYRWVKPSDLPERVELIDNVTGRRVATITSMGRSWMWRRDTTLMLHGAPPAEGKCDGLIKAKVKILDGLPNEL